MTEFCKICSGDHISGLCLDGIKRKIITDSDCHEDSEDCWCAPTIEEYPTGKLIIHNEPS